MNGKRFTIHAESADEVANDLRRDLLRQCEVAEYAMRANHVMSFFVPEHRGHDDLLNAAALLVPVKTRMAKRMYQPPNGMKRVLKKGTESRVSN